jgi:hypothetical protein
MASQRCWSGSDHNLTEISAEPEMRIEELQPQLAQPPAIDDSEAFLVGLFLRRYVTYCARRGRYAQMSGAARLLATLRVAFLPPPRPRSTF